MSDIVDIVNAVDLESTIATNDVVVVDFQAPVWCIPCQRFAPHFDAAAQYAALRSDLLGRTTFVTVDVDLAPWAMVDFGVQAVPTVKLFAFGDFVGNLQSRTAVKLLNEITDLLRS